MASIYLPNGNPQPGPKFEYKLAWLERLRVHAADLMAAGVPVVLAGDYNVVPTEADIWPGHHEQANALLQPQTRAAFQRLLNEGWIDALRSLQAEGPLWTFWGYLRHRWPNDKGMRLDHFLLSPAVVPKLTRFCRWQDGAREGGRQRPRAGLDRPTPSSIGHAPPARGQAPPELAVDRRSGGVRVTQRGPAAPGSRATDDSMRKAVRMLAWVSKPTPCRGVAP